MHCLSDVIKYVEMIVNGYSWTPAPGLPLQPLRCFIATGPFQEERLPIPVSSLDRPASPLLHFNIQD